MGNKSKKSGETLFKSPRPNASLKLLFDHQLAGFQTRSGAQCVEINARWQLACIEAHLVAAAIV